MDEVIRPARPQESEAVARLVDDAYGHYVQRIGKKPGPMLDDYAAQVAAGRVWVLPEPDGRLSGILVLQPVEGGLLLDNVAVAPAAQGRGIGRRLIDFAAAEARRRGHGALDLYTHALMTENIALYARLGFVETRRVSEKGFERVYMRLDLA